MIKNYTDEQNALIVIAILKANGIKRVIASPGATNIALVASLQSDQFFEMYSAVDERSAAYMACGLAHETGEPVVISCTGATASRNYLPGLTEAYYRKLPVLAITSTQLVSKVGHHVPQVIDRSSKQNDLFNLSVDLPFVENDDERWDCEVKVNSAVLALTRHGGGPAHINLPTKYSRNYETKCLPPCRVMKRFTKKDSLPSLKGRVAVFVGSSREFNSAETEAIDSFCAANNGVVFCDHTSSYKGRYRVLIALLASQDLFDISSIIPDVTIHIGEVSGDYAGMRMAGNEVWRVNRDGEIRDTFRSLKYVFEMDEQTFFESYSDASVEAQESYFQECTDLLRDARGLIPELPFSNVWLAQKTADLLPENSVLHFGILNSLRSWNFFELPQTVRSACNVGGFGIDGCVSSLIGASLHDPETLYFGVVGDLAFFYDMNSIGNRHAGNNLRIMVVNNGKGTEFRQYNHTAAHIGEDADAYVAAAGHFGNKSKSLIKNLSESLGYKYICAESKDEYLVLKDEFLDVGWRDKSIVFEVFTDSDEESKALEMIRKIKADNKQLIKEKAKSVLGEKNFGKLKGLLKR